MLALLLQCASLCILGIPLLFFWRRLTSSVRNLRGPPSISIWTGNLGQLYARNGWQFHRHIVEKYGGAVKVNGLLGCHQVYVSDPKAMYHILVKDASIYEETTWYTDGNHLVFGPGLLSTTGDHHRRQRKMLNPVFSIKHIRNLTPLFHSIALKMRDAVAFQTKDKPAELDMLAWMSRAALEIIGQGGLGTSIDPLLPDPNSITAYGKSIKNLIPTAFRLSMFRMFIPLFIKLGPARFRRFLLEIAPSQDLQKIKEVVDVMAETSSDIFRQKIDALRQGDEAVAQQVGEGKDVMSILLKANFLAPVEDRLPDDELIAQMSTFMFAGHDTTSSALSRTLHNLVLHPEVQEKLREEITSSGILLGNVAFEDLMTLPYLDAICKETLRVHPPINFMARTARKDVMLPLGSPVVTADGTCVDHVSIREGQNVIVAFGSVNRLQSVWGDDAYEWKPERWLAPLPPSVAAAKMSSPFASLMTFSAGPRSCIGFKYAELEMKMILAVLINSFKFELPEGKEIVWNLGGIQTPTASDAPANGVPNLPLKVSSASA